VNSFINQEVHPGTNYVTIPEFVETLKTGSTLNKTTPFQAAQKINNYSDEALSFTKELKAGNNKELHYILNDIKSMVYLGKYYTHKIKGSTYFEMLKKFDNDKKENREAAVKELSTASFFWKKYMNISLESYKNPIWTNRVGIVDWEKIYNWTLKDIKIVKESN